MEAVWKIEVEDFPAFIVVDDKGNDFFPDPAPAPTFTRIPVRGPGWASALAPLPPVRGAPAATRVPGRPDGLVPDAGRAASGP